MKEYPVSELVLLKDPEREIVIEKYKTIRQ